jgi:hypothetical protein
MKKMKLIHLMFVYNNFIKTKQFFTIITKKSHILARANAWVDLLVCQKTRGLNCTAATKG